MKEEPVRDLLAQLNSPIENDIPRICIVLAAGHGKRIRSETSKMLHEIWGWLLHPSPSGVQRSSIRQVGSFGTIKHCYNNKPQRSVGLAKDHSG